MPPLGDRVAHADVDVLYFQVRIEVADDPIEQDALVDRLEDVLDGDPGPDYMRLAEVNFWIYGDSVDHSWHSERLHAVMILYQPADYCRSRAALLQPGRAPRGGSSNQTSAPERFRSVVGAQQTSMDAPATEAHSLLAPEPKESAPGPAATP